MKKEKRSHERVDITRRIILISPDQEKISASIRNVSLTGLLICDPSSPIVESTRYKMEIHSINNRSIFLSGKAVWIRDKMLGMKITRYHLDGKELFQSFIDEITTTNEIVTLLDDGWLDYLFEDKKGKQLLLKYN